MRWGTSLKYGRRSRSLQSLPGRAMPVTRNEDGPIVSASRVRADACVRAVRSRVRALATVHGLIDGMRAARARRAGTKAPHARGAGSNRTFGSSARTRAVRATRRDDMVLIDEVSP